MGGIEGVGRIYRVEGVGLNLQTGWQTTTEAHTERMVSWKPEGIWYLKQEEIQCQKLQKGKARKEMRFGNWEVLGDFG